MNLRVFYKGNERMMHVKKTDKFRLLIELAKEELKIQENDQDWRIRAYSFYEDVMQENFNEEKIDLVIK